MKRYYLGTMENIQEDFSWNRHILDTGTGISTGLSQNSGLLQFAQDSAGVTSIPNLGGIPLADDFELERAAIEEEVRKNVLVTSTESILNWSPKLGRNQHLELYGTYAYTVSENAQTGYQLIYVPFHKATAGINYDFQRFNVAVQAIYVGEVFTRSDNNSRYNLDAYAVANFSLEYSLGKKKNYELGARLNNVFNAEYQSVVNRWMPRRNFSMYLNLKL